MKGKLLIITTSLSDLDTDRAEFEGTGAGIFYSM